MRFTGYHIEMRCEEGHYIKNVGRQEEYPMLRQYDNITDLTGFETETISTNNVINLNQHNLQETISGDMFMKKAAKNKMAKSQYAKRQSDKPAYSPAIKTGTTGDKDYSILDNLEVY